MAEETPKEQIGKVEIQGMNRKVWVDKENAPIWEGLFNRMRDAQKQRR